MKGLKSTISTRFYDDKTFSLILKLGQSVRTNLITIFSDQKLKMDELQSIDVLLGYKASDFAVADDTVGKLVSSLTDTARVVSDLAMIASGNPVAAIIGMVDIGVMTFLDVEKIFNEIDEMKDLEKKDAEI